MISTMMRWKRRRKVHRVVSRGRSYHALGPSPPSTCLCSPHWLPSSSACSSPWPAASQLRGLHLCEDFTGLSSWTQAFHCSPDSFLFLGVHLLDLVTNISHSTPTPEHSYVILHMCPCHSLLSWLCLPSPAPSLPFELDGPQTPQGRVSLYSVLSTTSSRTLAEVCEWCSTELSLVCLQDLHG